MFGLIDNLARRLIRRGLRRGLLEGSTTWVVIGAVAVVARLLARPDKEKVQHVRLKLGETITVSHVPPPARRDRRRKAHGTSDSPEV